MKTNKNMVRLLSQFKEEEIDYLMDSAINGSGTPVTYIDQTTDKFTPLSSGELELLKSAGKHGRIKVKSDMLTQARMWIDKDAAEKVLTKRYGTRDLLIDQVGDYCTRMMEIQYKTILKFWKNLDPDKAQPKSSEIVNWIKNEFGIEERPAQEIDRMVRPDKYRNGRINR